MDTPLNTEKNNHFSLDSLDSLELLEKKDSPHLSSIHQHTLTDGWSTDTFSLFLEDTTCFGLKMVISQEMVGFILMRLVLDEAEILTFAVMPHHQGHGYGRILLEAIHRILDEEKVRTIYLEVAVTNNRAIALYEKLGYKKTGLRPGYYTTPQGPLDAHIMAREV